jgi:hypothetical protein
MVKEDVRKIFIKDWPYLYPVSLVVASPPCQEFSYRSFPFKRCRELAANVPPDKSIWEACVRIAKECNAPLILENVRGAQKYMGKAVAHYGSFYLWGDVPPLLPIGRPTKGFTRANKTSGNAPTGGFKCSPIDGKQWRGNTPVKTELAENRDMKFPGECERKEPTYKKMVGSEKCRKFNRGDSQHMSSKSSARKQWSANAAMIPFELARWIGQCFYPHDGR